VMGSVADRNKARMERMAERIRSNSDAGAPPSEEHVSELPEPMGSGRMDVSEHPTLAHTAEITREAVRGLHGQVGKLEAVRFELETALAQERAAKSRPALLDPSRIRQSKHRDRVPQAFEDRSFEQLKREIRSTNGNVEAIKVRPIDNDDEYDYEVVYGHRRHWACLKLGLKVRAEVEVLDQRQMMIQMWAENQARSDLSLYERSLATSRMLDAGIFASRDDLGKHMNLTRSAMSKFLAIADVSHYAEAILTDPRDLTMRIASAIRARSRNMDELIPALVDRAKASGKLTIKQLREALAEGVGQTATPYEYKTKNGVLLDARLHGSSASLTIHKHLTTDQMAKLGKFVEGL